MQITALKNPYSLMCTAHHAGKNIANLDSTHTQSLMAIAENPDNGMAAQKAQNALCFHHNICYNRDGTPKNNFYEDTKPYPTKQDVMTYVNTSNAYPNPAVNYTTIQYNLLKAIENTELHMYDALGRQVETIGIGKVYEGQAILDTRKHANGVYIYEIVQDGKQVLNGKLIVNR